MQLGSLVPVGQVGNTAGQHRIGVREFAEQIILAVRLVPLEVEHPVHRPLVDGHRGPPRMPHRLEGSRLDQRLDHPLVAHHQRHLVQEAVEVHSLAVGFASGNPVHHVVPDVAYRGQAEAYVGTDRVKLAADSLTSGGSTWIPHAPALVEIHRHLVFVASATEVRCGHEFGGKVGLQVSGPIGDHPVPQ